MAGRRDLWRVALRLVRARKRAGGERVAAGTSRRRRGGGERGGEGRELVRAQGRAGRGY
jgi:hypothetical protein